MAKMQTAKTGKPTRREKSELKSRMSNFLMFIPNFLKLLGKLLTDSRVPLADKALFAGAIVYVIMPFDLIPDVIPFVGQIDDSYFVALALLRLINRTDETVVREHWTGGGDIVALANSIAKIAPMLLPKRVARILSAQVELAPAGRALESLGNRQALIVETIETPELIGKKR